MKNSDKLKVLIDNLSLILTSLGEAIPLEKAQKIEKIMSQILSYENDLYEAQSELGDAQDELIEAENTIDILKNEIEETEEEDNFKAMTLYDEQKKEVLEKMFKNCTLDELIEFENKVIEKIF